MERATQLKALLASIPPQIGEGYQWKLRKKDDRYETYDLELEDFVFSITYLNKGKSTTGHSHSNEEIYYFAKGWGRMTLGEKTRKVEAEDIVVFPGEVFHRVFNDDCPRLIFLCVFKRREE